MTPTRTQFQVVPTGTEWEIRRDGDILLAIQTKQVAIDEAVVQAELAKPSHVVVKDMDGAVEEEADFGQLPESAKERSRRRRTTQAGKDGKAQRKSDNEPSTNQPVDDQQQQAQGS